jgi:ApbE superfamily uncharacterized protein (UPF0280 family)
MRRSLPEKVVVHPGDVKEMNVLKRTSICHKETSLTILSTKNLGQKAREELAINYSQLERYIQKNPLFYSSYEPVSVGNDAPRIARLMACASEKAGVGPMAAVAGAFSDIIGNMFLEKGAREVIVENGGDIFMKAAEPRKVGIYAGPSDFSEKIGFLVQPAQTPIGICTSSDSVGPSINLGKPDAVTTFAASSALADAAATAVGNAVRGDCPVKKGILRAKKIEGLQGVLIIKGGEMGAWGKIPEIIRT